MPPTLILIRHAEGLHNVNKQYHIPDPGLSTLGVEQCRQLSEHLQTKQPLANQIELIVSSPMRRTLQTAMLSFDWLIARGIKIIPDANWQELSSNPCDNGSDIQSILQDFPTIDFTTVDKAWPSKTGPYEFSKDIALKRGQAGLRSLYSRPERVIAVVSHASFLRTCVAKRFFWNADYRIFDFEEDDGGDLRLREWDETYQNGGWLGRNDSEPSGVLENDFVS